MDKSEVKMRGWFLVIMGLVACSSGPDTAGQPDVAVSDASFDMPDSGTDLGPAVVVNQIDLLLMVDNTVSRDAQLILSEQLGVLIDGLLGGQAANGDRFDAPSLHVGVITSDMGTGGFAVPTCEGPDFGWDGVLSRQTRDGELEGPRFLEFDGDAPDRIERVQALVNGVGVNGCGVEQPLEAVLKALTPAASDTVFVQNTSGHGDGANQGFLRPDSLLVVLVLTDEDDCSLSNPSLFDASNDLGELNLRCFRHGDPGEGYLHDVTRYVEGLMALHPPERLVFHLIAAIPLDLIRGDGLPNYKTLIGPDQDPRLEERVQGRGPNLESSCGAGHTGHPPTRLLHLAQALDSEGATSVVHSICDQPTRRPPDVGLDSLLNELSRHL